MTSFKVSVSALALMAMTAGGFTAAALLPTDLYAQTSPSAPAASAPKHEHPHRHFDAARHVEGRIAYLKTVLKITPAQEASFGKLADAMRANAKERGDTFEQFRQNRDQPKNAVERLEMRERFTRMRAEQEARSLAALKPLYDTLSPEQKQIADDMTAPHWGHRGHRG